MPTSKDNPTPGETTADVTGSSPQQPVISDGIVSEDALAVQKPAVVQDSPGFTDVPVPDPQEVSDDFDTQYPEPVEDADIEEAPADEVMQEAAEEGKAEQGSTWAKYNAGTVHMRGLTLDDQRGIGVPQDAVIDNSKTAQPRTLLEPLEPGLWFTLQNRHRADITEAHPILREYLEEDADFELKSY